MEQCDKVLPVYPTDPATVIPILYAHVSVTLHEDLLVKVVSIFLEIDHAKLPAVPAHEDEHVSVVRLTAETAVDNLKDAGSLAAHVGELRYEVEVSQS